MHRPTIKIFLSRLCIIILAFLIFFSCQKELNPDPAPVSQGSLSKDSNGNCDPVPVSGTYYINQNLSDSNYLDAAVNVTSAGSFSIKSDTVNGYSFSANGIFVSTGLMHIKLEGAGKPLLADTNHFKLNYNNSTCEATVIVIDTAGNNALFSLVGAPDSCSNDTVSGTYVTNVLLDTNSTVKIIVDVTKAGYYNIKTNSINGYSFSGSGVINQTGLQTILLMASGMPINQGTDIFSIDINGSVCNFSIDVLTPLIITGDEYYPLTESSYWTYDDLVNVGDTIKETVVDSTLLDNNLYKTVNEDLNFGGPYQYYYRKSGTDYFEYAAPNKYTTFFQYKKPVYADIPFLKENISTNTFWESPEYIDTTTTGNTISLKYDFTCLNANATVTVNGKAFANVYEIKMLPLVKQTGSFNYTNELYLFYYAKGVGLIYLKKTLGAFIQKEIQIRNWHIN